MDYQEAIYCMKVMADEEVCEECNYYQSCDHTKQADMAKIAISAMNELQAIHNNGINLERLKDIDIRKQVVEHINYMEYMDIKDELEEFKQLGTLEEVREAVKTVRRYKTQYLDDMKNPLEPLKISSALKSEIMKLEFRKQSKPESISVLDYTIIAALQKALDKA